MSQNTTDVMWYNDYRGLNLFYGKQPFVRSTLDRLDSIELWYKTESKVCDHRRLVIGDLKNF